MRTAADGDVADSIPDTPSRSLSARLEIPPGLPEVWADEHRLRQVMENLLGNAMKFTSKGSVSIGAEPRGDEVVFWVTDTGTGIASADIPHVFERFWHTKKAHRTGAGLGLAIAKGIVAAHGGRIWVESEPGVGSTFFFSLPVATSAEIPQTRAAEVAASPSLQLKSKKPLALVVEDDMDTRDALSELLHAHGYDVVAAANGAEALDAAHRASPPTIVLLDLEMPVFDGWGFLEERSRDPVLMSIPVIAVSAKRDVAERLASARAHYIPKPVSVERLLDMMKSA